MGENNVKVLHVTVCYNFVLLFGHKSTEHFKGIAIRMDG